MITNRLGNSDLEFCVLGYDYDQDELSVRWYSTENEAKLQMDKMISNEALHGEGYSTYILLERK